MNKIHQMTENVKAFLKFARFKIQHNQTNTTQVAAHYTIANLLTTTHQDNITIQ